ncbi:MAG: hypothetical protein MI757_08035 [Pirellulales bacterium]|nr:hypothetical protein [Pirellulales bacterium]
MRCAVLAMIALCLTATAGESLGQDSVRFYEKDGVTYRETRTVTQRPLWETRHEPRHETVYREHVKTDFRNVERTTLVPVTQCEAKPYWVHRWNPFRQPYLSYRMVPKTTFQTRREIVNQPVVTRNWVPETRTVHVPVNRHRMVQEEVVSRVAVGGHTPSTAVASRPSTATGGTRMENDPPRSASGWRPAGSSVMR